MGLTAPIEDGKFVTSTSANSLAGAKGSNGSVNKDDFLQLLVAQMEYQDPLEPTDNTQWVSQYAQFSQVEEMQNMATSMSLSRASALVGQTVIMDVKDGSGNSTTVQGNVDYVSYEGGKAYLSIGGELYSLDDLSLVVDDEYLNAMKAATAFAEALEKLTPLAQLSLADEQSVREASEMYDNLSEYERSFLNEDYEKTLSAYVERMANLLAIRDDE